MKGPEHGSRGRQAEIDPQPGEGTAGGPARESLGTEGLHLPLLSYTGHTRGHMAPSLCWSVFDLRTSLYSLLFTIYKMFSLLISKTSVADVRQ